MGKKWYTAAYFGIPLRLQEAAYTPKKKIEGVMGCGICLIHFWVTTLSGPIIAQRLFRVGKKMGRLLWMESRLRTWKVLFRPYMHIFMIVIIDKQRFLSHSLPQKILPYFYIPSSVRPSGFHIFAFVNGNFFRVRSYALRRNPNLEHILLRYFFNVTG